MSKERIAAIDGLRAIAILEVVLYHLGVTWCDGAVTKGVITFFFVLSGYMMAMHYQNLTPSWKSWKSLIMKRMGTFYPLYWIVLLVFILFSSWTWRWDLPFHVFLLQSVIPDSYYCYSYTLTGWFMSTLLVCYMAFPMINAAFKHLRSREQACLVAVVIVIYNVALFLLQPKGDYMYYIFPFTRMLDFTFGMTLYRLYSDESSKSTQSVTGHISACQFLTVAVAGLAIGVAHFVQQFGVLKVVQYTLLWYVPAGLLLAVFAMPVSSHGAVSRLLSIRPLTWIGELSMEIYILHYIIITILRKLLEFFHLPIPFVVEVIVAVAVTILVSWMAKRLINNPVKKALSN